ncbi:hypothetical protein AB7M45_000955 [Bradyrhizobium elkanii]
MGAAQAMLQVERADPSRFALAGKDPPLFQGRSKKHSPS